MLRTVVHTQIKSVGIDLTFDTPEDAQAFRNDLQTLGTTSTIEWSMDVKTFLDALDAICME